MVDARQVAYLQALGVDVLRAAQRAAVAAEVAASPLPAIPPRRRLVVARADDGRGPRRHCGEPRLGRIASRGRRLPAM